MRNALIDEARFQSIRAMSEAEEERRLHIAVQLTNRGRAVMRVFTNDDRVVNLDQYRQKFGYVCVVYRGAEREYGGFVRPVQI